MPVTVAGTGNVPVGKADAAAALMELPVGVRGKDGTSR